MIRNNDEGRSARSRREREAEWDEGRDLGFSRIDFVLGRARVIAAFY